MKGHAVRCVAYSGADYSGKTTQANLSVMETQKYRSINLGALTPYFDKGVMALSAKDSFNWWFRDSTMAELADKLTDAYGRRYEVAVRSEADIVVFERGITNLVVQIAANFAVRNGVEAEEYYGASKKLVDQRLEGLCGLDVKEVVLTGDERWGSDKGFRRSLEGENEKYSRAEQEFYGEYLRALRSALPYVGGDHGAHAVVVDKPAVDINNQLRRSGGVFLDDYPELLSQDPIMLGISGMSESGKSTLAEYLRANYGYHRIKLGYFNEVLRGIGSYADANVLAMNMLHFVAANRHMERVTFESVYGQGVCSTMKQLVGERWKTVYLDVGEDQRRRRLEGGSLEAGQKEKDQRKLSAGISEIRSMADLLISGESTLEQSAKKVVEMW